MAKITLTFVCAFPIAGKESGKGGKSSKKKEKVKKKKKGKGTVEIEPTEKEEDRKYCAIDVGNITNFMHVEYALLPESEPCKVDLVSWGPVSKVCSHDEIILLKTVQRQEYNWSIFSVEHTMKITNDDIAKLKSHIVKFNINLTKGKVTDKLKSDKTKTFFVNKNTLEKGETFMNIFENKEDAENQENKSIQSNNSVAKIIISDLMHFPIEDELFQYLCKLPVDYHKSKILELMEKVSNNAEVDCLNSNIEEYIHVATGKKGKRSKEKKPKKSKKKAGEVELQFPGDLFITDPLMLALEIKETNANLPRAFVLISVFDFLSIEQKKIFNPMTLRIHSINNLPVGFLIQNGFNSLYVDCEIGNFLQYRTREVLLKKNVQLKDHRVFYTDTCTPFQYYEAIHHGFFKMQIFGRLLKKDLNAPKIFGYQKDDQRISKPIFKSDLKNNLLEIDLSKTEEVLLFVAYVRLNTLSLHSPSLKFTKLENCIHPENIMIKLADDNDTSENIYKHLNPLTDEILLTSNTSIDVDVEISIPFTIPNLILSSAKYFRRIIVIVYNKNVAKDILTSVILSNQEIFGPNLIIPDYNIRKKSVDFEKFTNIDNVITGFAVDMENFCFMYFEGLCERKMKDLWVKVQIIRTEDAKILYKSGCLFEERLYNSFIPFSGIFIITLQMGLKFVITNKNIFLSGTHSLDCRRALQKILLIHRTNMINDISFALLPTVQELISLDIECGVQLHLKTYPVTPPGFSSAHLISLFKDHGK